jgi:hypothetical protein
MLDPEYLVRYHAARTVLQHASPTAGVDRRPALLAALRDESAGARAAWEKAAEKLAAECRPR